MKIISLYGITRQSGKTTIAEEMALISQQKGYKTLLVDLDIHNGDVTSRLDLEYNPNISIWAEDIFYKSRVKAIIDLEYTQSQWTNFLQKHSSGLDVLATNTNPKLPYYGNIYFEIKIMFKAIRQSDYKVVIFDMGHTPTSFNYMILEDSHYPILVLDSFRYNVETLKYFIWNLEDVHFPLEKFYLLFNREPSFVDETPESIAKKYNLPLLGVLPEIQPKRANLAQDEFNQKLTTIFEQMMQN